MRKLKPIHFPKKPWKQKWLQPRKQQSKERLKNRRNLTGLAYPNTGEGLPFPWLEAWAPNEFSRICVSHATVLHESTQFQPIAAFKKSQKQKWLQPWKQQSKYKPENRRNLTGLACPNTGGGSSVSVVGSMGAMWVAHKCVNCTRNKIFLICNCLKYFIFFQVTV